MHPFDDPRVIAGQGTIALEMLEEVRDFDVLVIPIGGGGLIAGNAIAARAINPAIEVVGVEAALYPSMWNAMKADNRPCGGATLAEGIALKQAGTLTCEIVRALVSDIVLVDEAQLEQAVNAYLTLQKTMAEGAGAAGLAAMLAEPARFRGRKVGLILCGGNIDPRILASIMVRELERGDRIVSFRLTIPDRPGVLGQIATELGKLGANILEVDHRRLFLDVPAKGARLDVTVETRDRAHADEILRALEASGYQPTRIEARRDGVISVARHERSEIRGKLLRDVRESRMSLGLPRSSGLRTVGNVTMNRLPPPCAARHVDVAAVVARDLPHQRKAKPAAAAALGRSGAPVERLEHPLALAFGDARPVVADRHDGAAVLPGHLTSGAASPPCRRAFSIRLRIIRRNSVGSPRTEIASPSAPIPSRAASSAASASRSTSSARSGARIASSRLASRISSINWSSSAISALSCSRFAGSTLVAHEGERHVDAGERGAQLVRAIGEQHLVRAHELVDAAGGVVEARRERGDLVLAFDRDARREIALSEPLDPGLEPLEPAGEAPRDRIGTDADRQRQGRQRGEKPRAGTPRPVQQARHQDASVGERKHPGRPAPATLPAGFDSTGPRDRQRPACGRDRHAVAGIAARDRRAAGDAAGRARPAGVRAAPAAAATRRWRLRRRAPASPRSAKSSAPSRHSATAATAKIIRIAMIVR